MGRRYKQLSLDDRCEIARLQGNGRSVRQIAAALDRPASTIARELKRNSGRQVGYKPGYAQEQTKARRWAGSRLEREGDLRRAVLDRLAQGWSPEQVAGRLARDAGCKVISYESIYRFIYAQMARHKDYRWRHYLPRGKSKRGCRGRKGGSAARFIEGRVSLSERPPDAADRKVPGHWEADLMLFSKYGQAVLTVHERQSRLLIAMRPSNKMAEPIARHLSAIFAALPKELRQTITFDNGTEFARHSKLHSLGIETFFCDPYSPWQKGGIENAIGRMRRFIPRKTDLATLPNARFKALVAAYNNTPRKCLDWRTPAETFSQVLHFECESTSPPSRGRQQLSLRCQLGELALRRIAMRGKNVIGDQLDRGGEHRRVIGEAEHRQHVGNGIHRQHEIGDGAEQRHLHVPGRFLIERAVIGRQQILGEWNLRHDAAELAPEIAAQRAFVAFVVVRSPECRAGEGHKLNLGSDFVRHKSALTPRACSFPSPA